MHQEEAIKFAHEFRGLMYEMPFQAPENMILLGRCVSILSGICTGLDPKFQILEQPGAICSEVVQAEAGDTLEVYSRKWVSTLQVLVALPKKTQALLNRIEQGNLEVHDSELQYRMRRVEKGQDQIN